MDYCKGKLLGYQMNSVFVKKNCQKQKEILDGCLFTSDFTDTTANYQQLY